MFYNISQVVIELNESSTEKYFNKSYRKIYLGNFHPPLWYYRGHRGENFSLAHSLSSLRQTLPAQSQAKTSRRPSKAPTANLIFSLYSNRPNPQLFLPCHCCVTDPNSSRQYLVNHTPNLPEAQIGYLPEDPTHSLVFKTPNPQLFLTFLPQCSSSQH